MADGKLQIALYWGAGCGGCDVAVLDTNEFILDVAALADIRLWPIAIDGKYADVEAMADQELDVAFFNGAVRNSENEKLAKLLRSKSKLMVAFGSCAHIGGIPGLANQFTREGIVERVYLNNASIQAGSRTTPRTQTPVNGGELDLPLFYKRVYSLDQIVDVDYYLPGCPPAAEQVKAVITAIASGELPPRGSVVGASERAVCDDCEREKREKRVKRFYRPHQVIQDPDLCLMEQGILCMGSATRSGCGVRCPDSGMPCRGCYGPLPNVGDQATKFISSIASIIDSKDPDEIESILSDVPDVIGYACRFSFPSSTLQRSIR